MKKSKFKRGLVDEAIQEEKEELKQEHLRKKYDVEDQDVVVVEKTYFIGKLFRIIISIIVYVLAVIGVVCLLYAPTRDELIKIFENTKSEIVSQIPENE